MFETALIAALAILSVSMFGALYRVLRGPSTPDRVIALDMVGIHLLSIIAIISVMLRSESYGDIVLLIGIVAFIGTVAIAKFLEKGEALEYDRNRPDND